MDGRLTRTTVQRLILVACAVLTTLTAWRWLGDGSLVLPPHDHTDRPGFLAALVMWQAMVVAMMTPTVLPWIVAYGRLTAPTLASGETGMVTGPMAAFAGGYFAIWLAYSAVAAFVQVSARQAAWIEGGRLIMPFGGAVLLASGVSQFTPFKQACLTHCRNPLTYFLANWRNGPVGGFRMGVVHGAYCLGCCWLVMLSGFALGVMNLAWMAVLTAVLCVEQWAPWGVTVGRVFGAALAIWGLALLM